LKYVPGVRMDEVGFRNFHSYSPLESSSVPLVLDFGESWAVAWKMLEHTGFVPGVRLNEGERRNLDAGPRGGFALNASLVLSRSC